MLCFYFNSEHAESCGSTSSSGSGDDGEDRSRTPERKWNSDEESFFSASDMMTESTDFNTLSVEDVCNSIAEGHDECSTKILNKKGKGEISASKLNSLDLDTQTKRERRLYRNRISARKSRARRRREKVERMKRFVAMERELRDLRQENARLRAENAELRQSSTENVVSPERKRRKVAKDNSKISLLAALFCVLIGLPLSSVPLASFDSGLRESMPSPPLCAASPPLFFDQIGFHDADECDAVRESMFASTASKIFGRLDADYSMRTIDSFLVGKSRVGAPGRLIASSDIHPIESATKLHLTRRAIT